MTVSVERKGERSKSAKQIYAEQSKERPHRSQQYLWNNVDTFPFSLNIFPISFFGILKNPFFKKGFKRVQGSALLTLHHIKRRY